jgi:site-specific recombinase XerD
LVAPLAQLAENFIRDLLQVTGGGRATSFVDLRDHAMIRMLTEGVRREELAQQQITDLSENLIARPSVRVVPLMMTSAQACRATCESGGPTGRRSSLRCGWAAVTAGR